MKRFPAYERLAFEIAVVALAHLFEAGWVDQAHQTAKNWYPDEYQQVTGIPVTAEESHVVLAREFAVRNRDK